MTDDDNELIKCDGAREALGCCGSPLQRMPLPKCQWSGVVPPLECPVERGHFGIAQQVSDFSDRQRRVRKVTFGGFLARRFEKFTIRDALGGQLTLQGSRRCRQRSSDSLDVRISP